MAFLFLYYFFFFFLYTRSYPCYEKREGIRKETGHTMKRQWEKNLKAADSFWYLRLNNLERLFSSRNDPFFIFCFLFFLSFHSESHHGLGFTEVTWELRKGERSYDCNGIFSERFLRLRYPRSLMSMYCLVWCGVVYGVSCVESAPIMQE